jgi:hypothetical protein
VRASGVPAGVSYGAYPVAYGGVPRPINQTTIPLPQSAVSPLQRVKIDPKEFPISVTADNPLRYGLPSIPRSDTTPSLALPQAPLSPLIQEPPLATPLVARRVTGVGPMPYERYGFTLLPGWNGKAAATWPPYSAQSAPAGTLWNDELRTSGPVVAAQTASPQALQASPTSAQNYWNR